MSAATSSPRAFEMFYEFACAGEHLLVLGEGHCFRKHALAVCRRGLREPGTVFESDQFSSVFALVASGFGITVAPKMAVQEASGCHQVPIAGGPTRRIAYADPAPPYPACAKSVHRLAERAQPPSSELGPCCSPELAPRSARPVAAAFPRRRVSREARLLRKEARPKQKFGARRSKEPLRIP